MALGLGNAAEFSLVVKLVDEVSGGFSKIGNNMAGVGKQISQVGSTLTKSVTLPVIAMGAAAAKTAVDFESAFAGVIKTTEGLADDMGKLTTVGVEMRQGFRDLAKEVPVAFEELTAIGELGGQLGIARESLIDFTKTIAAMGVATNLTTEEAATGFAQIANIMGTAQEDISRMGSSVVDLGNNFATTERDILAFAQRIAGAGEIAGLTEADVFAIGTAMASVGVAAEAGGTAVQKALIAMTQAVTQGTDELDIFAATAGMTAEEFQVAFEEDAAKAFQAFIEGLGRQGNQAITTLDDLELSDQRLVRAFLSLANAGDLLGETIDRSQNAWDENIALTKEAEARYRTTESQMTILKNTIRDVAVTFGEVMLPAINDILKGLKPLLDSITDITPATAKMIITIAGIAAAVGPVLLVTGKLVTMIKGMSVAFGTLPAVISGVTTAFTALRSGMTITAALGTAGLAPIAVTLGAIGLAVGAVVGVWLQWNKQIVETNREGQKAVKTAWEDFFTKQVESGKDATEIAKEYRDAQDRVRQSLEDANPVVRLFIRNQDELKASNEEANGALLSTATSFEEYQRAVEMAGVQTQITTEAQFNASKEAMAYNQTVRDGAAAAGEATAAQQAFTAAELEALGIPAELAGQVAGQTAAVEEASEALLETSDIATIVKESFTDLGVEGSALDAIMDDLSIALGDATEEQIEAARTVDVLSDAFAFGAISADEFEDFIMQAADGVIELSDEQKNALIDATNHARSLRDAAEAAEELRLRTLEMSESLKDATGAQIAKVSINLLNEALEAGSINADQHQRAVEEVQEAYGLVTPESRALASGLQDLTQALEDGILPSNKMDEAIAALSEDAKDGTVDMDALLKKFGDVPSAAGSAESAIRDAKDEIGELGGTAEDASVSIEEAFIEKDWHNVGREVYLGIKRGIDEGVDETAQSGRDLAEATIREAKETFGVQSPSTVFMRIGDDTVQGLIDGLESRWSDMRSSISTGMNDALSEVTNAIPRFFSAGVDLALGLRDGIMSKAGDLISAAGSLVSNFIQNVRNKLDAQSPSGVFMEIGRDIVLGLIQGVDEKAAEAQQMIQRMVIQMREIARQEAERMHAIGATFILSLRDGIQENFEQVRDELQGKIDDLQQQLDDALREGTESSIESLQEQLSQAQNALAEWIDSTSTMLRNARQILDIASVFSGFGSATAQLFALNTLDPIQKKIDTTTDAMREMRSQLGDILRSAGLGDFASGFEAGEIKAEELLRLATQYPEVFSEINVNWSHFMGLIENTVDFQEYLNELTKEYEAEQEKILKLQEKQQQLGFLQQQLKLLETITEHGLDISQILGGLKLGVDADLDALMAAMTRAISALIQEAQDQLGISSPSSVFMGIGEQIMKGLGIGMEANAQTPMMAMANSLPRLIEGALSVGQLSPSYNLAIHSNAPVENMVQDFNTMRVLSGVF